MNEPAFQLLDVVTDAPIALRGVRVQAKLGLALSQVSLEQTFWNASDDSLEVRYTFPLAVAATLVSLEVVLGERVLRGEVRGSTQAEQEYEDALADGDGAFLLRHVGEGVYGISLGNLRAGEAATIRLAYVEPHRPLGGRMRFRLPTVIAPNYGDPAAAGYTADDAPRADLCARYDLSVRCELEASLAGARLGSPTHRIGVRVEDAMTVVDIDGAEMDRDFVLDVEPPAPDNALVAFALEDRTDPAHPGWATIVTGVAPATGAVRPSRSLVLLLDCSGSMKGDSITQAKSGARAVISSLRREDEFAIVRFGSRVDAWSGGLQRATEAARAETLARLGMVDADLGGTEIGAGIEAARKVGGGEADILLITDGAVHLRDAALTKMSRGGRIFAIGVGSAVSETVVRELAQRSGGAAELVTPNEAMAEAIARHAERMLAQRQAFSFEIDGRVAVHAAPDSVRCFPADPLLAALWTDAKPTAVAMRIQGAESLHPVALVEASIEARPALLALTGRLRHDAIAADNAVEAEAIALRYGLVTEHTSMIAVDVREADARAEDLPRTQIVPQQLAAGWAGTGSVRGGSGLVINRAPSSDVSFNVGPMDVPAVIRRNRAAVVEALQSTSNKNDAIDIPAFLRREADVEPLEERILDAAASWVSEGKRLGEFDPLRALQPLSADDERELRDLLRGVAAKLGVSAGELEIVVCALILSLTQHTCRSEHRQAVERAEAELPHAFLIHLVRRLVA